MSTGNESDRTDLTYKDLELEADWRDTVEAHKQWQAKWDRRKAKFPRLFRVLGVAKSFLTKRKKQ